MSIFNISVKLTVNGVVQVKASNETQACAAIYTMTPEEVLGHVIGEDKFEHESDIEIMSAYQTEEK
jgi:hypothetical protein